MVGDMARQVCLGETSWPLQTSGDRSGCWGPLGRSRSSGRSLWGWLPASQTVGIKEYHSKTQQLPSIEYCTIIYICWGSIFADFENKVLHVPWIHIPHQKLWLTTTCIVYQTMKINPRGKCVIFKSKYLVDFHRWFRNFAPLRLLGNKINV